jgi:hypothetical protein
MTNTYDTPARYAADTVGLYSPGHYAATDAAVDGETYVTARYHLVDAAPRSTSPAGTVTYCGWTSTSDEYGYDLEGMARNGRDVCPACVAVLDARESLAPLEPAACLLVDAPPIAAGTLAPEDAATVAAGRAAVDAAATGRVHLWHTVTMGMILSYWHVRHAAYWADMRHVSRTLTAAARARGWQHHYREYMEDVAGDVPSIVRVDADRATSFVAASGPGQSSHLSTHAPIVPPASIADIRPGTTVADVVAAVRALEADHVDTLQSIGDAFLTAADENDWCTDYERAVLDVVDGLSPYVSTLGAFRGRERDREYCVTVAVNVTRYVSVTVTASDEDSAADYAADNWRDYDDGDEYGADYDVEITEIEEA